jgi:hypothetical protein
MCETGGRGSGRGCDLSGALELKRNAQAPFGPPDQRTFFLDGAEHEFETFGNGTRIGQLETGSADRKVDHFAIGDRQILVKDLAGFRRQSLGHETLVSTFVGHYATFTRIGSNVIDFRSCRKSRGVRGASDARIPGSEPGSIARRVTFGQHLDLETRSAPPTCPPLLAAMKPRAAAFVLRLMTTHTFRFRRLPRAATISRRERAGMPSARGVDRKRRLGPQRAQVTPQVRRAGLNRSEPRQTLTCRIGACPISYTA